jgi:glyoxylase-like metal-dependent hydrolase (beta-lactamase superfamily II)
MTDLKVGRILVGSFRENCYYLYREGSRETAVVDPGYDGQGIYRKLADKGLVVKAILLTHGHFDHILGCEELRKVTGAPVYAMEAEKVILEDAGNNLSRRFASPFTVLADYYFRDGDKLDLCGMSLQVIGVPGHTIGGCCFYLEKEGILISGDSLFRESVGRTDHPTGNTEQLITAITDKLLILPGKTKVYPGHGETTTLEHEKRYNPFLSREI